MIWMTWGTLQKGSLRDDMDDIRGTLQKGSLRDDMDDMGSPTKGITEG